MLDIVWVASFPKSGNTWVRFILAHALFDLKNVSDLIDSYVPDMHFSHHGLTHSWNGSYVIKTHLPFDGLPDRVNSKKGIYIVRHPLDVVTSAVEYMEPHGTVDRKLELARQFVDNGNLEHWMLLKFDAWEHNVLSWYEASQNRDILILRYEDMLEDPAGAIGQLASYLDLTLSDARIDEIAEATSFKKMRAQEEADARRGEGTFVTESQYKNRDFRFMRKGEIGGYKALLTPDLIKSLSDRFKPAMEPFGYQG